jgi:hypothetical protein
MRLLGPMCAISWSAVSRSFSTATSGRLPIWIWSFNRMSPPWSPFEQMLIRLNEGTMTNPGPQGPQGERSGVDRGFTDHSPWRSVRADAIVRAGMPRLGAEDPDCASSLNVLASLRLNR